MWREKKHEEEAPPRREAMGGRREIETRTQADPIESFPISCCRSPSGALRDAQYSRQAEGPGMEAASGLTRAPSLAMEGGVEEHGGGWRQSMSKTSVRAEVRGRPAGSTAAATTRAWWRWPRSAKGADELGGDEVVAGVELPAVSRAMLLLWVHGFCCKIWTVVFACVGAEALSGQDKFSTGYRLSSDGAELSNVNWWPAPSACPATTTSIHHRLGLMVLQTT
jgi:hypothetical protein